MGHIWQGREEGEKEPTGCEQETQKFLCTYAAQKAARMFRSPEEDGRYLSQWV